MSKQRKKKYSDNVLKQITEIAYDYFIIGWSNCLPRAEFVANLREYRGAIKSALRGKSLAITIMIAIILGGVGCTVQILFKDIIINFAASVIRILFFLLHLLR